MIFSSDDLDRIVKMHIKYDREQRLPYIGLTILLAFAGGLIIGGLIS